MNTLLPELINLLKNPIFQDGIAFILLIICSICACILEDIRSEYFFGED